MSGNSSISLEDLINSQGQARTFDNPGHAQADKPINEDQFYAPEDMAGDPDPAAVDETSRRVEAKALTELLDTATANALATFVAKGGKSDDYAATEREKKVLENDIYEVTKLYPIKIDPRFKLLIDYGGTYFKYFQAARFQGEINELKKRQEEQEARIKKMEDTKAEPKTA